MNFSHTVFPEAREIVIRAGYSATRASEIQLFSIAHVILFIFTGSLQSCQTGFGRVRTIVNCIIEASAVCTYFKHQVGTTTSSTTSAPIQPLMFARSFESNCCSNVIIGIGCSTKCVYMHFARDQGRRQDVF